MLLADVKKTYARYLMDPTSDPVMRFLPPEMRQARRGRIAAMLQQIENARPFTVEGSAYDLISTMPLEAREEILGRLLDEAPLPFTTIWMEFTRPRAESQQGESREVVSGVMLIRNDDGSTSIAQFHKGGPEGFIEPMIQLEGKKGNSLSIGEDPFIPYRYTSDPEAQERRFMGALDLALRGLNKLLTATSLIAAKGGPLTLVEEQLMSRQKRRRLERVGSLPKGPPPTVTRIRINDQGRLHLQAVDEEEGGSGGARRRAHRVRGHFMETMRGQVWRRAHVRGFGPINETIRYVKA